MATKAKVIRNFFKKFFGIDAKGMSEVAVLRDVIKKKYDVDANGGSVVELLQDVISNNDELVDEAVAAVDPCELAEAIKAAIRLEAANVMDAILTVCPWEAQELYGNNFQVTISNLAEDSRLPFRIVLTLEATSDHTADWSYYVGEYRILGYAAIESDTDDPSSDAKILVLGETYVSDKDRNPVSCEV